MIVNVMLAGQVNRSNAPPSQKGYGCFFFGGTTSAGGWTGNAAADSSALDIADLCGIGVVRDSLASPYVTAPAIKDPISSRQGQYAGVVVGVRVGREHFCL